MKSYSVTIQMKATEQYFPVVVYQAVLTSDYVGETPAWEHLYKRS